MAQMLAHDSFHEDKGETILMLHGLGSSRYEWRPLVPLLAGFHLLIPDMNDHCDSRQYGPFTFKNTTASLAQLIKAKAHESVCHGVGFSAGGYVLVELAKAYPELFTTIMVSGVYDMMSRKTLLRFAPYLEIGMGIIPLPVFMYFYATVSGLVAPPEAIRAYHENSKKTSIKTKRQQFQELLTFGDGQQLSVRTLAIAAALPMHDDARGVERLGRVLRQGNPESRAYKIQSIHWWSLKSPELFAQTVMAWIAGDGLSGDFERLV